MRGILRWVTRAVLVRGVPELGGWPRTLGASSSQPLPLGVRRCSGSHGVPVVPGRGQGGWRRGSVRSCGVCPCGGALGSAFQVLLHPRGTGFCTGLPLCLVSGLSGMKAGQPASTPSEDSPLRASLPLCFLCALEGAGERPVGAESRGSSVGALVTPGSAPPLATARIPTIPGRKTQFNSRASSNIDAHKAALGAQRKGGVCMMSFLSSSRYEVCGFNDSLMVGT